ncbi:MAG TPA: DinB family protein [Vicinamibacterales bacterium]|nr:DinB family protein [Vicinamibacterales bacterium]
MPAWPARVIDGLNDADRHAGALARGLSVAQLNWRPSPGQWSIGQCLDHLLVANEVYLPPMSQALDGRDPSAVDETKPGPLGRFFIRTYIEPSTQRLRGYAPRKIRPAQEIPPDILERFLRSNDLVRALVRRASAYDVNRIRFVNPFVPLLRFNVATGIEVLWRHQHRHLRQAERVRKVAGFPAA